MTDLAEAIRRWPEVDGCPTAVDTRTRAPTTTWRPLFEFPLFEVQGGVHPGLLGPDLSSDGRIELPGKAAGPLGTGRARQRRYLERIVHDHPPRWEGPQRRD